MSHAVLTALRESVMVETEPLSGLLRKCLLLGAEVGSKNLREWARLELNGYTDEIEVPSYRSIHAGMLISYVSGYNVVSGQAMSWYELPAEAREIVPEQLTLRVPLAALEQMAAQDHVQLSTGPLSVALQIVNKDLPFGQQAHQLAYAVTGPILMGIVDRIRTSLVELIADLTADTPLDQLPSSATVDAALKTHVGVQYTTNIHALVGPVAIGQGAHAQSTVEDLSRALTDLRDMAVQEGEQEIAEAIDDLQNVLQEEEPATGSVAEKAVRLSRVATNIGSTALSSAVSGVVETATSLAFGGLFG
ncbi:hypothetical protein M3E04_010210 [Micrococcus luteus]|nr:hypothetical protein [Micrococcus luteus]